jgi:hypothetical protein
MRLRRFFIAGLLAALPALNLPSQAAAPGRGQGFRPCPYRAYTCPVGNTCKPFEDRGRVVQVLTETLEEGMYPGMALLADTQNQGRVLVHLGPVWYLERQEFEVKPGDELGLKGMSEKKNGKVELIAYELTRGDHVLQLRDSQGRPHWEAWRKR